MTQSPEIHSLSAAQPHAQPLAASTSASAGSSAKPFIFLDHASTTPCCEAAVKLIQRFATEDFGNPSSSHVMGQQAAKAIKEARQSFARQFNVDANQVIFTGSGSEADNLAVYGVALQALARRQPAQANQSTPAPRVVVSAIEHPAVLKTAQSLVSLGFDVQLVPVDSRARVRPEALEPLLTPETVLVSIMLVNNIVGSIQPVEELAALTKAKVPSAVFHTDAVQAFGRVPAPRAPSPVDLVSISAHKVQGPKGVGALIVLNRTLLKSGLRPLIWGGEQENGFRSGTQNAGLIAGFQAAAELSLREQAAYVEHASRLRAVLQSELESLGLLGKSVIWNSPEAGVPHIVSLSIPGYPAGPLAKLLEERGCLVSTGSACSSMKAEPDRVLVAMGLPPHLHASAIRVSLSASNTESEIRSFAAALRESVELMSRLLGGRKPASR